MCGIPSPDNVTAVVGAGKESVLVLDAYLEEGGSHSPRVETFAFGPNGSTNGCPTGDPDRTPYGLWAQPKMRPKRRPTNR